VRIAPVQIVSAVPGEAIAVVLAITPWLRQCLSGKSGNQLFFMKLFRIMDYPMGTLKLQSISEITLFDSLFCSTPHKVTAVKHLLANLRHFEVLQESDLDWITTIAQPKTYQSSSRLIEEGQALNSIYLALNGNLAVLEFLAPGRSNPLLSLAAGEWMGEAALLNNHPATTSIEAIAAAEVLELPLPQLSQKLSSDRDFAGRFYHLLAITLSERLRRLSTLMAKRQIKEGEPLRKVLMVFATLSDSDVSWMLAHGMAEKIPSGTTLIEQDKSVPAVYLLLDGVLGIYIDTDNDGPAPEIEVAKRVKGDIFGEMSFVDGGLASATVRALEPSWVLAIPQATLTAKLQADSGFASRFYRAIVQILSSRCQDLLIRGSSAALNGDHVNVLSTDIEVEDELNLDVLEGTAIAATRFDWLIQQLRR
jgi:bacteriocin-type transport-associated protein